TAASKAEPALPTLTSRSVAVEHIGIGSAKPFADVCAALERAVPPLDPDILKLLADGDIERVDHEREHGPEPSIFLVRDHGALLQIAGRARNARQYDIGNPITASLMTRHQLAAAQYAPIRVVLYENEAGHAVFEYDQPSSVFGQFDDEQVNVVRSDEASTRGGAICSNPRGALRKRGRTRRLRVRPAVFRVWTVR